MTITIKQERAEKRDVLFNFCTRDYRTQYKTLSSLWKSNTGVLTNLDFVRVLLMIILR